MRPLYITPCICIAVSEAGCLDRPESSPDGELQAELGDQGEASPSHRGHEGSHTEDPPWEGGHGQDRSDAAGSPSRQAVKYVEYQLGIKSITSFRQACAACTCPSPRERM